MKYVKKLAIVTLSLLMAMLSMIGAPAALAADDFSASDWIMVPPGEAVYGDANLQYVLTETTSYKLVKLASVLDGAASVYAGGRTVYISLQYISHLREGDRLVTNCSSYIYEDAGMSGVAQAVQANETVEFISVSGDCAKVRHEDAEGYIYIKHLNFTPNSRRFTVAIPTSLE